jgi:hypothetical protein
LDISRSIRSRYYYDGCVLNVIAGPSDPLEEFDAVDLWHADVEKKDVFAIGGSSMLVAAAVKEIKCLLAVREPNDLIVDPGISQVIAGENEMSPVILCNKNYNLPVHISPVAKYFSMPLPLAVKRRIYFPCLLWIPA